MFIALWILLSIGAGAVANAKGRSGIGYFLLALLLSPLVGLIIAACMPSLMYVDASGVRRRILSEEESEHRRRLAGLTPEERRSALRTARVSELAVIFIAVLAIAAFIAFISTRTPGEIHSMAQEHAPSQYEWIPSGPSAYKRVERAAITAPAPPSRSAR